MPCRSDYMEPTTREKELQRSAQLLLYVLRRLGIPPLPWVARQADSVYASDERSVIELCATLRAMDPATREALIYNPHERDARDLATWWEEHQAADRAREAQEADARHRNALRQQALSKLSAAERRALGLE